MAANAKVILELVAENRKMLSSISEAVKETDKLDKGAKTATKSFGDMGGVLKGLAGVFSVAAATFAAKEIIQAATAHEKAVNKVSDALARVGADVGPAALKSIKEFATSVQKSTGVSSEMFLELQSKAASFGASSKEVSQKFAQAAIETAAATGESAEEIIKKLSQTTKGEVGEIGKLLPGIKSLTKEQLAAGEAAKLLIDRYSGSSAAAMGNFSFAVNQSQLAIKDLAVQIGTIFTESGAINKFGGTLADSIYALTDAIKNNKSSIITFFETILDKSLLLAQVWFEFLESSKLLLPVLAVGAAKIAGVKLPSERIAGIRAGISGDSPPAQPGPLTPEIVRQIRAGVAAGVPSGPAGQSGDPNQVATMYGQAGFIGPGQDPRYMEAYEAALAKQTEEIAAAYDEALTERQATAASGVNAGLGGLSSILSGNAAGGVAGIAGMGADMLLPGIGSAVASIVAELAKGPEHVRDMINQFVDSLPEVLANIAEAIPVVIETLIDRLPQIVEAIAENAPRIAIALAKALADPRTAYLIAQGIVRGLAEVWTAELSRWGEAIQPFFDIMNEFFTGFFDAIGVNKALEDLNAFFDGFGKKIGDLGDAIWDGITGAFNDVFNWIGDSLRWVGDRFGDLFNWISDLVDWVTGGAQKVGGALGKVGSALGLASGGYVRGMGTGDSVPALLAPGELVVDRETGPQLRSFLSNQGNQEAILMEMVALLRQPMTIQTTAEVDKRAFANILLTMSRQNQRLTA